MDKISKEERKMLQECLKGRSKKENILIMLNNLIEEDQPIMPFEIKTKNNNK